MTLSKNFKPLYEQVYDILVNRLANAYWKPSEALPSEFALAEELGVSQGTVRKALNQMMAENMLVRHQGKGTYVAEHTQESSLSRFFHFSEPNGLSLTPETKVISSKRRPAKAHEKKRLNLKGKSMVVEMLRVRSLKDQPTILETIIQPLSIFPNIDKEKTLPNFLYELYQDKYAISIVEIREELRASLLTAKQAKLLKLPGKTPVLCVERTSISLDGRAVEWSEAICSTENFVYSVSLK